MRQLVILVAGAVALLSLIEKGASFVAALAASLLHLLVDAVMENTPTNGTGGAWLWLVSGVLLQPINLLEISNHPNGWRAPSRRMKTLLPGALLQLPFIAIAFVGHRGRAQSWLKRTWRRTGRTV